VKHDHQKYLTGKERENFLDHNPVSTDRKLFNTDGNDDDNYLGIVVVPL